MSDLSERLRELAFSFDGRSEENASLLREAADALDAAEKERDEAFDVCANVADAEGAAHLAQHGNAAEFDEGFCVACTDIAHAIRRHALSPSTKDETK